MNAAFPVTSRTRMRRKAKRATYDRETIYAILDEALVASVAVAIDGQPHVQPMIHCRVGDRLIFHGHGTNRLLAALGEGAEACINVFFLDALAVARTIAEHSMLYRSATVYGRGDRITDESDKLAMMQQVFAKLVGGSRFAALPPLEPGYLGGTAVVAVGIEEAVGKVNDQLDTSEGPDRIWSGLIPARLDFGPPVPDERTAMEGLQPEQHLAAYTRVRT